MGVADPGVFICPRGRFGLSMAAGGSMMEVAG